jgi:hypothetical protein
MDNIEIIILARYRNSVRRLLYIDIDVSSSR